MATKMLFGNVPYERDEESGEELDADGIGCFRGAIFSLIMLGAVVAVFLL